MAGNDLTIRNNRFIDIRRSNIDVAVASGGDAFIPDSPAATKNILIEGNNFSGYGQPNPDPGRGIVGNVIFLSNTENVQVQNNTIGPRAENTPRVPEIILTKARGITLSNNKIAGATGNDWLEVKDNVNMNSVTIK
jgi:hypothetical protein